MEKKLVSVVITTYKREIKYVKEAVQSVLDQTYPLIEILLVDDNGINSEFQSDLLNYSQKKNIRYIQNRVNSGAQFSRNIGILASKGEYIAFLDDDDIWAKDKIEKQMVLFQSKKIGMVFCDGYTFVDGDMEHLGVFRDASIYNKPISYKMELFNDYIGSTSQALVRKTCFARVGLFDCDMPARQDYEMWLRISREYEIVGVPEKLLYYRIHSGERISTNWQKCFNSYNLILKKYREDYKKNTYAKSKLILRLFSVSLKMNKYLKAIKYLIYAFIINPKCVIDVVIRHIERKTFNEFYSWI